MGLTDGFSYDTDDTEDICDYDGHEPIYKYGTKVCNQFKFCKNGEHAVGTCPEGQYFDTVVGESSFYESYKWVILNDLADPEVKIKNESERWVISRIWPKDFIEPEKGLQR